MNLPFSLKSNSWHCAEQPQESHHVPRTSLAISSLKKQQGLFHEGKSVKRKYRVILYFIFNYENHVKNSERLISKQNKQSVSKVEANQVYQKGNGDF